MGTLFSRFGSFGVPSASLGPAFGFPFGSISLWSGRLTRILGLAKEVKHVINNNVFDRFRRGERSGAERVC